jgi:NADH-quinone oxidoreductase subunit N
VFIAAVEAGLAWLAAIALIFAVVSAYYYMRVVMVMYMRDPAPSSVMPPRLITTPTLSFVLACAVAGVILFGLYPNPLVSFALQSVLTLK